MSWKLQCDTVSHTVTPFIHLSLLASVHCRVSLVWLEASGFYYTINAGPSLKLLLDILLLPFVVQTLQFWVCRTSPFTCSSRSQVGWDDRVDAGVSQLIALVPGLGSCRIGQLTSAPCLHHQGKLSTIAPACSALAVMSNCFSNLRIGFPTPTPQGQLYCVAQVRCRSPECCSW